MSLQGHIDEVTPDGTVIGWACRPGQVARLHLGLFAAGRLVAEAVTDRYRAGLLAAGYGLGHCAFAARLKENLAPGEHAFEMTLLGADVDQARPLSFTVTVPDLAPDDAPTWRPSGPEPHWTDEEILGNLEQFRLDEQLAALGPARFVDAIYRFVLERWAEEEMMQSVRRADADGTFSAEDFLRQTLESDERRRDGDRALPSPFDYRFPFRYPVLAK